ncbi:unnamed protein product [Caenorhabditis brenneri]
MLPYLRFSNAYHDVPQGFPLLNAQAGILNTLPNVNYGLPCDTNTSNYNLQTFPSLNAQAGFSNILPSSNRDLSNGTNTPNFNFQNFSSLNTLTGIPYTLPNVNLGLQYVTNPPTLNLQNFPSWNVQAGIPNTHPNPTHQQSNVPLFNIQGNQILQHQAQVQPFPNSQTSIDAALSAYLQTILRLINQPIGNQMLPTAPEIFVVGEKLKNVNLAPGTNYSQAGIGSTDVTTTQIAYLRALNPTLTDSQIMAIRKYAPEVHVPQNPVPGSYVSPPTHRTWWPPIDMSLSYSYSCPPRKVPVNRVNKKSSYIILTKDNCAAGRLCRARFYTGNIELKGQQCRKCGKIYHTHCYLGSNRVRNLQLECCTGSIQAQAMFNEEYFLQDKANFERKKKIKEESRRKY